MPRLIKIYFKCVYVFLFLSVILYVVLKCCVKHDLKSNSIQGVTEKAENIYMYVLGIGCICEFVHM